MEHIRVLVWQKTMVDYENIYIVDTLTAVAGIRLLCEVAINWIDENRSVENIVSGLEELKRACAYLCGFRYIGIFG